MSAAPAEPDLDALVARWRGPLVGLFLARGLDRASSHDLAEEVFVEAWLGLRDGRFRGEISDVAALGLWLRGIARNLGAAHFRSVRRAPRAMEAGALLNVEAEEPQAPNDAAALRGAIDRLPKALKEVVFVRYLDEHTGAEAAALLGLTEKAVERRAARARALLKELMASPVEGTTAREKA